LTILSTGTLVIDSNGVIIDVIGCVTLGGSLQATVSGKVQDGDNVDIITSRSGCISGSFDSIIINNDGCEDVTAKQEVDSTRNKFFVVLQLGDKCNSSGLSIGVIGGIIAAAVGCAAAMFILGAIAVRSLRKRKYNQMMEKKILME